MLSYCQSDSSLKDRQTDAEGRVVLWLSGFSVWGSKVWEWPLSFTSLDSDVGVWWSPWRQAPLLRLMYAVQGPHLDSHEG